MSRLLSSRVRMIAAIVVALAWTCPASASEEIITCDWSRVAFDAKAFPKEAEFECVREDVGVTATDPGMVTLRKEHPDTWQLMTAIGQMFSPENTSVDRVYMGRGTPGIDGFAFFAVAKPNTRMSKPDLRKAIDALARFNLFSDKPPKIEWQGEERVGDYTVLFYLLLYPGAMLAGGPRECFTYVRYLDGTAASHTTRIGGTYCEVGIDPLDAKDAKALLQALIIRP